MSKPKSTRAFDFEDTETGFPPAENAIIREAVAQYRRALCVKWSKVREVRDENEGSVTVSARMKVDCAGKRPSVVTAVRLSIPDEPAEEMAMLPDPDQPELPVT